MIYVGQFQTRAFAGVAGRKGLKSGIVSGLLGSDMIYEGWCMYGRPADGSEDRSGPAGSKWLAGEHKLTLKATEMCHTMARIRTYCLIMDGRNIENC